MRICLPFRLLSPKVKWWFIALLLPVCAVAQNNQVGDLNTATLNSTVDSNNVSNVESKTYNGAGSSSELPVYSAVSPSLISSGNDSCLMSRVGGLQLVVFGASAGKYIQDDECNRRKNAKTLHELGMNVAAVSLLCQDSTVWRSMFVSGTPCPLLAGGRLVVGRAAFMAMKASPELYIPDYDHNEDFYNHLLGVGLDSEEVTSDSGSSISERFRTSR